MEKITGSELDRRRPASWKQVRGAAITGKGDPGPGGRASARATFPFGFVALAGLTAGMLVWPGFVYAYLRTRYRPWGWCALGYLLPPIARTALAAGGPVHGGLDDLLTVAMFALGGVGAAHLMTIREGFEWRHAARLRIETRHRARAICRHDPERARTLGIGRPDLPNAFDAGLVDLNHVHADVLERLPGVDTELAAGILDLRSEGVGFASLEDMDLVLNLPLTTLQELQDVAVFLPRD